MPKGVGSRRRPETKKTDGVLQESAANRFRRAWLSLCTPILALGVGVGLVASGLAGPGLDTLAWAGLMLTAVALCRVRALQIRRIGWLAVAASGFVLAGITSSTPMAMAVLFLGAPWLTIGALILVDASQLRLSGFVIVTLAVSTLIGRQAWLPLPELGGPVGLAGTAVVLALALGGMHALAAAAYRTLASQHARTIELRGAVTTLRHELDEARARTLAANEATDHLIATISHELRTPLNAVQGYTEIVLEDLEDTKLVGIRDDLQRIREASSQLLDLIGSMLELTPVDPQGRDLEVVPVDVAGVVADAVGIVVRRLEGNGNRVRFEDSSDQTRFCTDLPRLRHLVVQLLSNAASLVRNGSIHVRWGVEDDHLVLVVQDEGPGLPDPAELADLRQIGLHGPRRLVRALEGELEIRSVLGEGTTVQVRLPDLDRLVRTSGDGPSPTIFPPSR